MDLVWHWHAINHFVNFTLAGVYIEEVRPRHCTILVFETVCFTFLQLLGLLSELLVILIVILHELRNIFYQVLKSFKSFLLLLKLLPSRFIILKLVEREIETKERRFAHLFNKNVR